jgi:hypothetical protein
VTSTGEPAALNHNSFVDAFTHSPFVASRGNIEQKSVTFDRFQLAEESNGLTLPCRRPVINVDMGTNRRLVLIRMWSYRVCTQILQDLISDAYPRSLSQAYLQLTGTIPLLRVAAVLDRRHIPEWNA